MKIDMTIRMDAPLMLLKVGDGYISFNSPWQDNRKIDDFLKPSGKPNLASSNAFDNGLPAGQFADISIIINRKSLQVSIDGEVRYHTAKLPYMKQKELPSLELAIVPPKLAPLMIKAISLTESEADFALAPVEEKVVSKPDASVRATFDAVVTALPDALQRELLALDLFIRGMRPLKFKRSVEKHGNKISYVASDFGCSYVFSVSGTQSTQHFGWYLVANGKVENWHVKHDSMEMLLARIDDIDSERAARLFRALNDCVGCYGVGCLARRQYGFAGRRRTACHGRAVLGTSLMDFQDVHALLMDVNALWTEKAAAGEPAAAVEYLAKK